MYLCGAIAGAIAGDLRFLRHPTAVCACAELHARYTLLITFTQADSSRAKASSAPNYFSIVPTMGRWTLSSRRTIYSMHSLLSRPSTSIPPIARSTTSSAKYVLNLILHLDRQTMSSAFYLRITIGLLTAYTPCHYDYIYPNSKTSLRHPLLPPTLCVLACVCVCVCMCGNSASTQLTGAHGAHGRGLEKCWRPRDFLRGKNRTP